MAQQTTQHQMKMAKASQHDFDTLLNFLGELEEMVEDDANSIGEWVKEEFNKVAPCWRRVVWGYETLARSAADPNLSYLDWKPEIKAAMEMYEVAQATSNLKVEAS